MSAILPSVAASSRLLRPAALLATAAVAVHEVRFAVGFGTRRRRAPPRYADTYGVYDGAQVELLGLVSRPAAAPGAPFEVARFMTSCCAADAIPYSVRIRPGPGFGSSTYPSDAWLAVSGVVRREPGGGFVVESTRAERRREPADPYLSMGY